MPGAAADAAVGVGEQFQRRAVVQDAHPGPFHPMPHGAQVLRTLQTAPALPPRFVDRVRVPPGREVGEAPIGLVDRAEHPAAIGEVSGARLTLSHGVIPGGRVARYVPDVVAARGGRAAGAAVALVGEHHPGVGPGGGPGGGDGGGDGGPGARRAAAEDQDVRVEPQIVCHGRAAVGCRAAVLRFAGRGSP
ncbi:hypothetical protein AB0M36_08015 [Actinoplanes sp. NPDC051346]|uniref:hypothetical protein n=1 Tax=Actinoplanes sp. NPDC051346 TaxID=3155048 RepID=UPI00343CA0C5